MSWIVYALLAPLCWVIVNLFDKYLIDNHLPSVTTYLVFTGTIGLTILFGIPFLGFSFPPFGIILLCLFTGALFNYQLLPYFKALSFEEASRVAPIFQISPLFVLILSLLFLHERISVHEFIAFPLIVTGSILISIEKIDKKLKIRASLWYMLLSASLYAIYLIISKYIYLHVTYYTGLSWISIGGFIGVLPLLIVKANRTGLGDLFIKSSTRTKLVMGSNEFINVVALIFIQLAVSLGPSSIVSAIAGIGPLYLLILTFLVTKFFPKFIHEETHIHIFLYKLLAVLCILTGVIFVSI